MPYSWRNCEAVFWLQLVPVNFRVDNCRLEAPGTEACECVMQFRLTTRGAFITLLVLAFLLGVAVVLVVKP